MRAATTDHAAKRLLVGAIGSIYIMTHTAFLRSIGTSHSGRLHATFSGVPGNLLGNMREIGSAHM